MEVLRAALTESFSGLKELLGAQDQVPITVTGDGVLIEIIDKDKQAFFDLSSAAVKPTMRRILELVVNEIKNRPNKLVISGHTDAVPYHDDSFYSNWELSAARALNTRHALQQLGLPSERFDQVTGYADRKLRVPDNPRSPENRRISILIKKTGKDDAKAAVAESAAPTKNQTAPIK
jgi:chemotaxis protein MotB